MYKSIATLYIPISLCAMSGCTPADSDRAAVPAPAYAVLDDQSSQLRDDFNRHRGSVRLLFVIDPICPGCLRGIDDMNKDLLAKSSDPRLRTFVVHVPVIGATRKDIIPSMKLLQNPHVRHYWNGSGAFGRELARAVGLRRGDELVYAWDVWLLYGPEAVWDDSGPPQPRVLMHQLWELQENEDFPFLDSEVFAQQTSQLLARLPPPASTPNSE
ncbi:MAG: hypothetical protein ACREQ8_15820 [Woeseiaceae bacterium]